MANEKILIVDDDKNICELLRLYLNKEGYQISLAHDGQAAVDTFEQQHPDLVLLDVMMPKMDGWEVCRRIRAAGDTPVIMLTAKGETFDLPFQQKRGCHHAGPSERRAQNAIPGRSGCGGRYRRKNHTCCLRQKNSYY